MFTGLIEDIGTVSTVEPRGGGRSLRVRTSLTLEKGDSIAVNGVCLTAADIVGDGFRADVGPETIKNSNLGSLTRGDGVNLETAVRAGDPMGGHIVTGHVDCTGRIVSARNEGTSLWIEVKIPTDLVRYVIDKGSICIDGTSLTVARVSGDVIGIMVIPETRENTIVSGYRTGTAVNVEVDVLAKMIEKSVGSGRDGISVRHLEDQGY